MNSNTLKTNMAGHIYQSQTTTSANNPRTDEDLHDQTIPLSTLAMNIFAQEDSFRLWSLAELGLEGENISNQERSDMFNTVLREEWDKLSQGRQSGYLSRAKSLKVTRGRSSLLEEYVL
jgi:hypothetical protein